MEATTRGRTVLVVDDLANARKILGERLTQVGFDPSYAEDGLVALYAVERHLPDLVVTGRKLPRLDGIGFLRRLREISDVPVVMVATPASVADCEEAMRAGANRYLDYGRDLDRVASVACDLVEGWSADPGLVSNRSVTARGVRLRAKRALRRQLQDLLVECRGNIAEMARRMGKDRSTIRYHLRRLGMLDESNPVRVETAMDQRPARMPSSALSRGAG